MKLEKGIVKYMGRSDIPCYFGKVDDKVYYFLDPEGQKKLRNGNRIASTALVEAIDPMVKPSNIGVVDPDGNEVIPFTNRAIKPVNDDVLLVELATPISESVIEAANLKADPLSATKLVSTPALIKDKMNAKMGSDGRYLFNDQFSEATVCDINGNNLINGEYFSFIGIVGDKLYFSKNIVDSDIVEYSLFPPEVQANVANEEGAAIDVSDISVPQDVVENALTQSSSEAVAPSVEESTDTPVEEEVKTDEVVSTSEVAPIAPPEEVREKSLIPSDMPMDDIQIPTVDVDSPEEIENDEVNQVMASSDMGALPDLDLGLDNKEVAPVGEVSAEGTIPPVEENTGTPVEEEVVSEAVIPTEESTDTPVEENTDTLVEEEVVSEAVIPTEESIDTPAEEVSNEETVPPVEENTDTPVEEEAVSEAVIPTEESIDTPAEEVSNEETVPPVEENTDAPVEEEAVSEETIPVEESTDTPVEEVVPALNDLHFDKPVSFETEDLELEDLSDEVDEGLSSVLEDSTIDVSTQAESSALDNMVGKVSEPEDYGLRDSYFDEDDNVFRDSVVKVDHIVSNPVDDFMSESYSSADFLSTNSSNRGTTMQDVANSMKGLIDQVKSQKSLLAEEHEKLEKMTASRRNIADKAKMLEKKAAAYEAKMHSYEALVTKMETQLKSFDEKVREQERLISSQAHELDGLRSQLKGRDDLVSVYEVAKSLLGENGGETSYPFDEGSYYRRAA